MTDLPELPWQDISTLTPEPGGDEVFVWNGERWLFANWRYGWSFDDEEDEVANLLSISTNQLTTERCWCDGGQRLNPQPTHYLPLSPPRVRK